MRRLITTIVLLVAVVAAVGFYMGWFSLTTETVNGKPAVTVTVDKDKIQTDKQRAKDEIKDLKNSAKDKVNEGVEKVK